MEQAPSLRSRHPISNTSVAAFFSAMVNDLLELNDTALTIDNGKGKLEKWILDDKDNFWLENKYWDWKDVKGAV